MKLKYLRYICLFILIFELCLAGIFIYKTYGLYQESQEFPKIQSVNLLDSSVMWNKQELINNYKSRNEKK